MSQQGQQRNKQGQAGYPSALAILVLLLLPTAANAQFPNTSTPKAIDGVVQQTILDLESQYVIRGEGAVRTRQSQPIQLVPPQLEPLPQQAASAVPSLPRPATNGLPPSIQALAPKEQGFPPSLRGLKTKVEVSDPRLNASSTPPTLAAPVKQPTPAGPRLDPHAKPNERTASLPKKTPYVSSQPNPIVPIYKPLPPRTLAAKPQSQSRLLAQPQLLGQPKAPTQPAVVEVEPEATVAPKLSQQPQAIALIPRPLPELPPAKTEVEVEVEVQDFPSRSESMDGYSLMPQGRLPCVPRVSKSSLCKNKMNGYRGRAMAIENDPPAESDQPPKAGEPMWWSESLRTRLGFAPDSIQVDIGSLIQVAMESSPLVRSILTEPRIRQSDIVIADADFDTTAFLEAKFVDTNEPVGNQLTTGDNSDRFRDETYSSGLGIRKRTRRGGQLEIAQRGGFQENNSIFLNPNPQGTTRMEINFSQPLLRDGGKAINNVQVVLAQLDVQAANNQVRLDLEDHLIDVVAAYWDLYQARADWLQRHRLQQGAQHLSEVLLARGEVDSQRRQILRANAAVESRKADVIRAATRVRNAQSRLRMLTGSPQLIAAEQVELTPRDIPLSSPVPISTRDSLITALDNRADIADAIRRIHTVSVRVGAAKNQVLPRMDLLLGTYVAGLSPNSDTFRALGKQYADGRPSYSVGFLYELPIGNRASKARLERSRWEYSRAMYDFHQTMEVTFAEIELAVRETQATYTEMVTKKQSIVAATSEVLYLQQRWDLLPDPEESAILLIEDLLDAQQRLANEERAFVTAQVNYAMSWIKLRKAMGILLQFNKETSSIQVNDEPLPMTESAVDIPVLDQTVPETK